MLTRKNDTLSRSAVCADGYKVIFEISRPNDKWQSVDRKTDLSLDRLKSGANSQSTECAILLDKEDFIERGNIIILLWWQRLERSPLTLH